MRTGGGQWLLAILVGGALLAVLLQAVVSVNAWAAGNAAGQVEAAAPTATPLGMALLGVRTDRLDEVAGNAAESAGMSGYLLVFEIISVHLLVVLVGAAYLARAKRHGRELRRDEG
jgi:NADH-quinone oxidoreductase subunit J